jgi:hypothetical protein
MTIGPTKRLQIDLLSHFVQKKQKYLILLNYMIIYCLVDFELILVPMYL